MFERPGHADDAVLDIGPEAMHFVHDQHIVMGGIDVGERPSGTTLPRVPPELILPGQADVLALLKALLRFGRRRVGPGQDLIAPLSDETVRNDDERAKVASLISQGVQDHQGLDGLTEPDLIRQQVSDS